MRRSSLPPTFDKPSPLALAKKIKLNGNLKSPRNDVKVKEIGTWIVFSQSIEIDDCHKKLKIIFVVLGATKLFRFQLRFVHDLNKVYYQQKQKKQQKAKAKK